MARLRTVGLQPGALDERPVRIPVTQVETLLPKISRRVADLAPTGSGIVVWTMAGNELLVDVDATTLRCSPGLVSIEVRIALQDSPVTRRGGGGDQPGADRSNREHQVRVDFAVGTTKAMVGLVMAAGERPAHLPEHASVWAEPVTAFAWEVLIRLAEAVCADIGHDASGRTLIPSSVAAERDVLIVQPMARHAKFRSDFG